MMFADSHDFANVMILHTWRVQAVVLLVTASSTEKVLYIFVTVHLNKIGIDVDNSS